MSPPAEVLLRASGLRVERRGERLIVRSGPPAALLAALVLFFPTLALAEMLRGERWHGAEAAAIPFAALWAVLWMTFGGSWRLTLDRRAGWATRYWGPWRARRALATIVGVRPCSLLQFQIRRVREQRKVMPYAPVADIAACLVLVEAGGRWWRVTRSQDRSGHDPRPEQVVLAGRLVAEYLGIPFLPPYETPPGGVVPPPLEPEVPARHSPSSR